ncbi:MAG: SHOCT domain-containing protein [Sulfuricella sp.]
MMWNYEPWGGFPWMWIFPLIFLVVMLVFLFRGGGLPMCGGHETHGRREESARELLDRRYARGEISREDYQQMKKDLE